MYLDKLDVSIEQLNDIIEALETTYGGEKYVTRLREIRNEMYDELEKEE
jgi:hypothetical protein